MKKRIRIHGFLIFAAAVLVALFPGIFLRLDRSRYDLLFFTAGILFLLTGFYLRIWARGFKAEHSDNSNKLVTGGPYSLTRNPMYLGIFFIALGVVLSGLKAWVFLVFLLFFALCYVRLMFQEQKKLAAAFGEEYMRYKKRTPLFIPRPSSLLSKDVKKHLAVKALWVKKEIRALLPVLLLAAGFNLWKFLR